MPLAFKFLFLMMKVMTPPPFFCPHSYINPVVVMVLMDRAANADYDFLI